MLNKKKKREIQNILIRQKHPRSLLKMYANQNFTKEEAKNFIQIRNYASLSINDFLFPTSKEDSVFVFQSVYSPCSAPAI